MNIQTELQWSVAELVYWVIWISDENFCYYTARYLKNKDWSALRQSQFPQ